MAKNAANVDTTEDGWETVVEPFAPTWDFDENGTLVGIFVNHRVVEQPDMNNEGEMRDANVYEITNAGDGEKYSVWGTYAIDEAFKTIPKGNQVRIIFEGKVPIDGGKRTVNQFRVQTKAA